jgi:hypothetical protein
MIAWSQGMDMGGHDQGAAWRCRIEWRPWCVLHVVMKGSLSFVCVFHWACTAGQMVQFLPVGWCPNSCVGLAWLTWRNVRDKEIWEVVTQGVAWSHHGQLLCSEHCTLFLLSTFLTPNAYLLIEWRIVWDSVKSCFWREREWITDFPSSWQSLSWPISNIKANPIFQSFQWLVTRSPQSPANEDNLQSQNPTKQVFGVHVFTELAG